MTNKRDWDSFVRSKERFRCGDYFNTNKTELFNFWLDSGKSWDACVLHVDRVHQTKNESKKGWTAFQGWDLVDKYGKDRGEEMICRRTEENLFNKDDMYPDDPMEACL